MLMLNSTLRACIAQALHSCPLYVNTMISKVRLNFIEQNQMNDEGTSFSVLV